MNNQRSSHCAEVSLQLEPYMNSSRLIEVSICHFAAYAIGRINIWFGAEQNDLTIRLDKFNLFFNVRFGNFRLENHNIGADERLYRPFSKTLRMIDVPFRHNNVCIAL